jgi:hypothetical protein
MYLNRTAKSIETANVCPSTMYHQNVRAKKEGFETKALWYDFVTYY